MSAAPRIRAARVGDLPSLRAVERAAGALFREIGMDAIAADEPATVAELAGFLRAGLLWVAADGDAAPVGYLMAGPVDDALHIDQVSVDPGHGRRGIGRALIDRAGDAAAELGLGALTLTTFAAVLWNAPYYERLGFRRLRADQ